ncbi:RloB family protein [Janthinobacterium sp. DSP2-3-3]|uniref:RloB family protein n=1 Tax=Janthinobacterium sp. DSP2-3-3 TaxID=2804596 RepID=UPI003CE67970
MGRSSNSFGRGASFLRAHASVLIICEDTKSGKQYLNDAAVHFRVAAEVEVAHVGNTDPLGIVTQAIAREKKYNSVYCVIDRDTHENFDKAVLLAKTSKKVKLIVSYPCFEFWLLLHFKYNRKTYCATGKHSPGAQMLRALKECDGMAEYEKGKVVSIFNSLIEKLPGARGNAERIIKEARADGEMNPSTLLYELLDDFEDLAQPEII